MDILSRIKQIINIDLRDLKSPEEYIDYIEKNLGYLQDISKLQNQEMLGIKEDFYKFMNYFRVDFLNSGYNETYAQFVKVVILFLEKVNNISQIQNFIEYFPDGISYKYKIKAIIKFRQLPDKNELPNKIKYIIRYLKLAKDYGESDEILINILKEYFNKLFSRDEFQDTNSRKLFIENIKSIEDSKIFLDHISLNNFLDEKLKEETVLKLPKEKVSTQKIADLEIKLDSLQIELDEKKKTINQLEEKNKLLILEKDVEQSTLSERIKGLIEKLNLAKKERETLLKEIKVYKIHPSETKVIKDLKTGNKNLIDVIKRLNKRNDEKDERIINLENKLKERDHKHITEVLKLNRTIEQIEKEKVIPKAPEEIISLENLNIVILGSKDGENSVRYLNKDNWFEKIGLNRRNIDYVDTWKDKLNFEINSLVKRGVNIVLIGPNDHYLKGCKETSQDAIFRHLQNDDLFNNIIVKKVKLVQKSTKAPKITKTSLKVNLKLALEEYKTQKSNDSNMLK
jgi:hypothetical protein